MWWRDGSCSDNSKVGATAVCTHGNASRSSHSFLGTGPMEVIHTKQGAIVLTLSMAIKQRETLLIYGETTVAVFSNSQATIRRTSHLATGPERRLARQIHRRARSLLAYGIASEIHWVPGDSIIPRNQDSDS